MLFNNMVADKFDFFLQIFKREFPAKGTAYLLISKLENSTSVLLPPEDLENHWELELFSGQ